MNAIGRVTICASVALIVAKFLLGIVAFHDESYTVRPWHVFLVYQFVNLIVLMYDMYILQRTPWTHKLACLYCIKLFALEEMIEYTDRSGSHCLHSHFYDRHYYLLSQSEPEAA